MPAPRQEDEDDLYEDDFEFVDDDDLDDEPEEAPAPKKKAAKKKSKPAKKVAKKKAAPKKAAKKKVKKKAPAEPPAETPEEELEEPLEQPVVEEPAPADEPAAAEAASATAESGEPADAETGQGDDSLDEFGRPKPVANYVVHVYEQDMYRRTIDRDFTPEDAESFATEYSRTAKPYSRVAVAGKKDTQPPKMLGA